jgi:hypothetical protein
MDLADVVRRHGPDYLRKYGARMPGLHRAALDAILRCHTPGCGHRACNQCGQSQQQAWLDAQTGRLLPVGYFLVTFTVPEELRRMFRSNQRLCYGALFVESAQTLQDIARQPRYLGGDLGLLGVLHTWTRQLDYHPHIHYLVPGVVLREDGDLCFPKNPEYLLPVRRLSARLRARIRKRLHEADPALLAQIPAHVWRKPWVVHSQFAGRGQQALSYLARYVTKTAIASARLISQDDHTVTFSYRESGTNTERTTTLKGEEFLRRFLQHVLPKGFRRVRTYGWLSAAAKTRFERVRTLLNAPDVKVARPAFTVSIPCRHCQKPMRRVADFGRGPPCHD